MTVTFAVYIVCILLHPFNGLFQDNLAKSVLEKENQSGCA